MYFRTRTLMFYFVATNKCRSTINQSPSALYSAMNIFPAQTPELTLDTCERRPAIGYIWLEQAPPKQIWADSRATDPCVYTVFICSYKSLGANPLWKDFWFQCINVLWHESAVITIQLGEPMSESNACEHLTRDRTFNALCMTKNKQWIQRLLG